VLRRRLPGKETYMLAGRIDFSKEGQCSPNDRTT
jgi:hypothetical protein